MKPWSLAHYILVGQKVGPVLQEQLFFSSLLPCCFRFLTAVGNKGPAPPAVVANMGCISIEGSFFFG